MSKALLVASIMAGVALATTAVAEPFDAGRSREGAAEARARAAEQRRDLWEARDRMARQRNHRRYPPATQGPPPGQNAGGYPRQTPYAYGAPNGGGYGGDFANPPPRPPPPPSPRGLHDGLWYY